MHTLLGWLLIIFPGLLFFAQLISSVNFRLAQNLGLQENPKEADHLLQRAERYTAYWDLVTLPWLPLSGILMLLNHPAWPVLGLLGGAIYVDAAGREAAKILSFKHEGIRLGPPLQRRLFFSTYFFMVALGMVVVVYSVAKVWIGL